MKEDFKQDAVPGEVGFLQEDEASGDKKSGRGKYKSVKEYTKDKSTEERRALAQKISARRKEKFSLDKGLQERIDVLLGEAESGKLSAQKATEQVQLSQERLSQLEEGFMSRLLSLLERRRLKKEIGAQEESEERFNEEYTDTIEAISSLRQQKEDRTVFLETKKLLHEFYNNKEQEWLDYEKEEQKRDITYILEHNDIVIVHALIAQGVPEDNSRVRRDTTWQEKLKMVLAFGPTLATSGISEKQQGMWANMGVLVNGGRVEAVGGGDLGSVAKKGGRRHTFAGNAVVSIEQNLQDAMSVGAKSTRSRYNEILVSNPKVCGFFVEVNDEGMVENFLGISENGKSSRSFNPDEVLAVVESMELPLFAVRSGQVYRINASATKKESLIVDRLNYGIRTFLKLGEKVTPKELSALPEAIGEAQKEKFAEEILEDAPVKLDMIEAKLCDARNGGRESYVILHASDLAKKEDLPTQIYKPNKSKLSDYKDVSELFGKEIKIIGEIKSPISVYHLFVCDGKFYQRKTNKRTGNQETDTGIAWQFEQGFFRSGVDGLGELNSRYIGDAYQDKDKKPIDSTGAYFEEVKRVVDGSKKELGSDNKNVVDFYKQYLEEMAFTLYGFAEEAELHGDILSKDMALQFAEGILEKTKYQEVVSRRVGPNGEFRITKEEI